MRRSALIPVSLAAAIASSAWPAAAQSWRYSSRVDQFSDGRISTASGQLPNGSAGLFVRCSSGMIEAFYSVRDYLDNEGAQTRYRIDGGEVFDDYWNASTDGGGVFSPTPGIFARRLAAGNRVVIQAEQYNGSPITYTFNLSGSGAVIGRVLSDCGLPARDPHVVNDMVWPRVVDDLDLAHPDDVAPVQEMLEAIFRDKRVSDQPGIKGQSTYEALSSFYAAYWSLCEDEEDPPSEACERWRSRKRYDADADYGIRAVPLLLEYVEATLKKSQEPATEQPTA